MYTKKKCDFDIIGKRIKNVREAKGMTQEQLASRSGIVIKHLSNIECGQSGISLATLIEIAEVLDVSTDYLLLGKEPQHTMLSNAFKDLGARERYYLEQIISNYIHCFRDEQK